MPELQLRTRLVGVLFLGMFLGYGYLAQDIHLDFWATEDHFNARTFPEFIAMGGMLFSGLFILFPGRIENTISLAEIELGPALRLLGVLAGYGLVLTPLGFLPSTCALMATGAVILGERRWWLIAAVSTTIPLFFQILMTLLDIHLEPGLLGFLHD